MLVSEILTKIFDDLLKELEDEYDKIAKKWDAVEIPNKMENGCFPPTISDEILDNFQDMFQEEMTPADISKAQELAIDWWEKHNN